MLVILVNLCKIEINLVNFFFKNNIIMDMRTIDYSFRKFELLKKLSESCIALLYSKYDMTIWQNLDRTNFVEDYQGCDSFLL